MNTRCIPLSGLVLAATLSASSGCRATEAELGVVTIDSVALIAAPLGLHQVGNLELKLHAPFALPPGMACDTTYVTTSSAVDADGLLLAMLLTGKRVAMRITDAPATRAYPTTPTPGVTPRCSVMAMAIYPN